jgi:GWxTD domain-containing protein
MKRFGSVLAVFFTAGMLGGQPVPELFQKAKEQVKAGSWQEALATMEVLETEAAKPANDAVREQLEGPLAFYRGVCEANVGQADKASADFETFLRIQPNASMDPKAYSKKAVSAFEKAQKATDGSTPSLLRAYKDFKPPAASEPPVDASWDDGPVQWLMSADEKAAWTELTDDAGRVAFVAKFWAARDSEDDHSFRPTFEKRVAFADANFGQDPKRGSLTDRGMVFVLVGPPTYGGRKRLKHGEDQDENAGMSTVGSHDSTVAQKKAVAAAPGNKVSTGKLASINDRYTGPSKEAAEASLDYQEVWHYRKELLPAGVSYLQVDAVFLTKKSYGVNVLQREPDVLAMLAAAKKKPE